MVRAKITAYVPPDLADALKRVAAITDRSVSDIVEDAIARTLMGGSRDAEHAALMAKLNAMQRRLGIIERSQETLFELTAHAARFSMSVAPDMPEADRANANARGAERFRGIIAAIVAVSARARVCGRITSRRWRPPKMDTPATDRRRRRMTDAQSSIPAHDPARGLAMLATALGPAVTAALQAPDTIEIIANPDGRIWVESHGCGRIATGLTLAASHVERVIRLVATLTGAEAHQTRPIVSAELPPLGERFEGILPPVSRAPCFAIRKPAQVLFRLQDYVAAGIMSEAQSDALRSAATPS